LAPPLLPVRISPGLLHWELLLLLLLPRVQVRLPLSLPPRSRLRPLLG